MSKLGECHSFQLCTYAQLGETCPNGLGCPFPHSIREQSLLLAAAKVREIQELPESFKKKKACKHYLNGRCKWGDACGFLHSRPGEEKAKEMRPQRHPNLPFSLPTPRHVLPSTFSSVYSLPPSTFSAVSPLPSSTFFAVSPLPSTVSSIPPLRPVPPPPPYAKMKNRARLLVSTPPPNSRAVVSPHSEGIYSNQGYSKPGLPLDLPRPTKRVPSSKYDRSPAATPVRSPSKSEELMFGPSALPDPNEVLRKKFRIQVCKHFKKGYCHFGSKCRFIHMKPAELLYQKRKQMRELHTIHDKFRESQKKSQTSHEARKNTHEKHSGLQKKDIIEKQHEKKKWLPANAKPNGQPRRVRQDTDPSSNPTTRSSTTTPNTMASQNPTSHPISIPPSFYPSQHPSSLSPNKPHGFELQAPTSADQLKSRGNTPAFYRNAPRLQGKTNIRPSKKRKWNDAQDNKELHPFKKQQKLNDSNMYEPARDSSVLGTTVNILKSNLDAQGRLDNVDANNNEELCGASTFLQEFLSQNHEVLGASVVLNDDVGLKWQRDNTRKNPSFFQEQYRTFWPTHSGEVEGHTNDKVSNSKTQVSAVYKPR